MAQASAHLGVDASPQQYVGLAEQVLVGGPRQLLVLALVQELVLVLVLEGSAQTPARFDTAEALELCIGVTV